MEEEIKTEEFDDALEARFEKYVEHACKEFGLNYKPKVIFIDGYIPEMPHASACIDILSWTIKVSRIHLKSMTDAEIKDTAFHEVTHLFNASHDTDFRNRLADMLEKTWEPPSGVTVIDGNVLREVPKPKKTKVNPYRCLYCGKIEKTKLKRCPHCNRYFCEEHLTPSPPKRTNFDNLNKYVKDRGENHHPCAFYYDYLLKQEKEMWRKYKKSLDTMSGKRHITYREIPKISTKEQTKVKDWIDDEPKKNKRWRLFSRRKFKGEK